MTVTTVGLDLAKDVFQVHGISASGRVVFNRAIKRAKLLSFFETLPRCTVGMEACGSAHHWGRELRKLGHDVRLMPAFYVKPYVKRGKTDAVDAEAICEAVQAAGAPVVLAVHSASGFSGYAASDRVPDRIAAMVYVDTAPGKGALDPDFEGVEKPMVWSEIEEEENLDGLSEEQRETFRQRAVPVPGSLIRETVELTNDARRDIPSTLICTGFSAEQYQTSAREHPEWAFLAGVPELRNATWIDLPTSHWPMWSRPHELARIIGDLADQAGADR